MPTTCSSGLQPNSRSSPHGGHRIGRATNTAVHAAPAHRLRCHSTSAIGTAHTQWCDHEIGEASSMATAPRQVPSTRSPRRHQRRRRAATASESGTATASHSKVGGGPSSSRVSAPCTDWLCASSAGRPGRVDQAVGPVRRRRSPASPRTRPRRCRRRPGPPAPRRPTSDQHEQHDEDEWRQLHARGDPDQHAGPAALRPEQVDQHGQHQEQVDLPEREVLPHRLQGQRPGGDAVRPATRATAVRTRGAPRRRPPRVPRQRGGGPQRRRQPGRQRASGTISTAANGG